MPAAPSSTPGPPARSLRILYAEDLEQMRLIVRLLMEPLGHRLEFQENGQLAWDRIRDHPADFDLVITDHHMPVMNGLEFVRHLRTTPFTGRIIVFSSDLDPGTARAYQVFKVDKILNKPIEPDVLRQVVAELFAQR